MLERAAGILIATATLARADAHRCIDVQPGAVPETGRRGPRSRLRLRRTGPDRDVVVTVENVDEPPEVLRKVLDAVPDLRYCLDVGHAHLDKRADGARKYLAVLGDRLGLAHIHDNHGGQGEAGDEHLPFGQGTIDLERDVTALRESGYEGYATLEIFKGIPDDKKACLRKMRRWTREDPP